VRRRRFFPWRIVGGVLVFAVLAVVLVLGTIGAHRYYQLSSTVTHEPARISDSLYLTLQCFTLAAPPASGPVGYPMTFQIARFLAPFVLFYATVYALIRIFRQQLDYALAVVRRNHTMVLGFGERGQALTLALSESGTRVVVIDQQPDPGAVRAAREMGVRVLTGDARDGRTAYWAGVHRATEVAILCGSDTTNGEVLSTVRTGAEKRSRNLMAHVQVLDIELAEELLESEFRFGPRRGSLVVDFLSIPQIAANSLLDTYPPAGESGATRWPRVLIVGSGRVAEALLIQLAKLTMTQQLDEAARVVVVDPGAPAMVADVELRHPKLRQMLDISTEDLETLGFDVWKTQITTGSEVVYICLEDESRAMAIGLHLDHAAIQPRQIVVVLNRDMDALAMSAGHQHEHSAIAGFAIRKVLNDHTAFLGGFHEGLARSIHEAYRREMERTGEGAKRPEVMVNWELLSPEMKNQNRDQAEHYVTHLESIGLRIVGSLAVDDETVYALNDDEVEKLAVREHDRWMKVKVADGWKPGPKNEEPDPKKKTHPDLYPFKDVPQAHQNKDRSAIRNIPTLLNRYNCRIVSKRDQQSAE
jgi:TrkA-N domain/RyR domain